MWEGAQRLLGGFYHTRWFLFQGMLQKMGGPEVPVAGELEGACRTFQSCHWEVQTRVSILQSKFMNSHQEVKKRINEKDTKLINTEKKPNQKPNSDACRKIPLKCTDAQCWGFSVADRVDKKREVWMRTAPAQTLLCWLQNSSLFLYFNNITSDR